MLSGPVSGPLHPEESAASSAVAAWQRAAADPAVRAAHAAIVDAVEESLRVARPICLSSGRCCHFERFGHRLMVTGLETAIVLASLDAKERPTAGMVEAARAGGTCPFLRAGRCGIHGERPIPCRTFFCDGTKEAETRAVLEAAHAAIRALHDRHGLPYGYDEWRSQLARFAPQDPGATIEA